MRKIIDFFAVAVTVALLVAGCGEKGAAVAPVSATTASNQQPTVPIVTAEDWKRALLSTYKESKREAKTNGETTFDACFNDPSCSPAIYGSRDEFRKIYFFSTLHGEFNSLLNGTSADRSYANGYVALKDCRPPEYLLFVRYFAKRGLLFMNRVAIMVDGEVVLEKDLSGEEILPKITKNGVSEEYQFILSKDELAGLRKVAKGKSIIVRITGRNNQYVTLPSDKMVNFKGDIRWGLEVYDKLNAALEKVIPPSCT